MLTSPPHRMDLLALGRADTDDELISAALCPDTPSAAMLNAADAMLGQRLSEAALSLSTDAWGATQHFADINNRFYHGDLRATPAELVSNAASLRQLAAARILARYSASNRPRAESSEMGRLSSAMETSHLTAESARESILRPSVEEVALDAALSSQVGALRAIRVERPSESEKRETMPVDEDSFALHRNSQPQQQSQSRYDPTAPPPPLQYSAFIPRPSSDRRARGGEASTSAARLLLSEWEIGTHPRDYVPRNPYADIDPDVGSSGTESVSSRASSRIGGRQRSGTAASQRTARTPSVPPPVFAPPSSRAPPSVAPAVSSTQPTQFDFASQAVGSSSAAAEAGARRYHSQVVPGVHAGGVKRKPAKSRRVGGF